MCAALFKRNNEKSLKSFQFNELRFPYTIAQKYFTLRLSKLKNKKI